MTTAHTPRRKNRMAASGASSQTEGMKPSTSAPIDVPEADRVARACAFIRANLEGPLTLDRVASTVGLSRFHFQRVFKARMGLTPRQFAEACRVARLKRELRGGPSVTDAIYEAGFGSGSRVYERVDTHLGMTPGEYRAGGRGVTISYASADTALGRLMLAATDRGLCFVQFGDSDAGLLETLRREYPAAGLAPMDSAQRGDFRRWMRVLAACVRGRAPSESLPLDVQATAFQAAVWRHLQTIPVGETRSYAQVAEAVGRRGASRAVARACASNRLALVVPCHRVIRGTGDPGGYRWGVPRKLALLEAERAQAFADATPGNRPGGTSALARPPRRPRVARA